MHTIAKKQIFNEEIKRSRFIATAIRVDTPEAAMNSLKTIKILDANHNCWAYKIGNLYRFFDDGEPSGTGGRPILAAIEGQGLDNVLVVVARYFGGIKLGTGGLIRAYGGTAAKCLGRAQRLEVLPTKLITIESSFEMLGVIHPLLQKYNIQKLSENYSETGFKMSIKIPVAQLSEFKDILCNATCGKVIIEQCE